MKRIFAHKYSIFCAIAALVAESFFISNFSNDVIQSDYRWLVYADKVALFPYFAVITLGYGDPYAGNPTGSTSDVIWFWSGIGITFYIYVLLGRIFDRVNNKYSD
jgi:hypothetical protein